eukprot:scaffold332306_cov20-Attheya_sp.AAC.1
MESAFFDLDLDRDLDRDLDLDLDLDVAFSLKRTPLGFGDSGLLPDEVVFSRPSGFLVDSVGFPAFGFVALVCGRRVCLRALAGVGARFWG